jgi:triosephosphate isomerase
VRTPIIGGNWKMNTTLEEAATIVAELSQLQPHVSNVERVVIPPFPWIVPLHQPTVTAGFQMGAQTCAVEDRGAFTGEVSAVMLKPYCTYIIAGHSERRHILDESDEIVAAKVQAILRNGMRPIICVGETLEEREAGQAQSVVAQHLRSALERLSPDQIVDAVIAYEPVWAIGTGRAATPDDAQNMAAYIRSALADLHGSDVAERVRIQYGGSVNGGNAESLLSLPDIDGALVGGASLKPEEFSQIIDAAVSTLSRPA